ncbi:acylneuraminate cytidylyltransferase [Parcubacteria bacterium DG_74_2]|nr:MAG: acylneuraminate cytidylyltransferase [Parcubacteria bacterium DG_74_2]
MMSHFEKNIKKAIVALVPIKAHSERVPNKNIRSFAGKPLYYYILNSLLQNKYIQKIYVNTDSKIISRDVPRISKKIKIIERPKKLRGDYVSMNNIIAHDLSQIDNKYFLQTHTTNPLLTAKTINKAIEIFFGLKNHDSLFSVTKLQTRLYDKKWRAINHNPNKLIRTQDLLPIYEENSNLYIFSKDSFEKQHNRIGEKPYLFEINKLEAMDIDTEEDFKIAETIKKANII